MAVAATSEPEAKSVFSHSPRIQIIATAFYSLRAGRGTVGCASPHARVTSRTKSLKSRREVWQEKGAVEESGIGLSGERVRGAAGRLVGAMQSWDAAIGGMHIRPTQAMPVGNFNAAAGCGDSFARNARLEIEI
jgi:hypothetical protein